MTKIEAIQLFGTGSDLAKAIGISPQAIYKWPDILTPKIEDRVIAAIVRQNVNRG